MPRISEQVEWLSLVDISGPFLAPALLEQVFPQGLEKVETPRRQRIRSAYEEWRDAVDEGDAKLIKIHAAWVLMVLQDMLEYEDSVLMSGKALNGRCSYRAPESGTLWVPDYAIVGDDGKYRMFVSVWPPETDLEKVASRDSWLASPLDRMISLCRANDIRLGLVTDGERWMVVNAPVGSTSGYAAWLARLWWQEPVTLKAFQSLLGVRRCFGPSEDTLTTLLSRSTDFQEEVTDTLGEQVRRAVEILVQSIARADQDRNGALLESVRPAELYEAGLTVMMRLVFTLCAEERDLLLLGDPIYDQHYAISTLRACLREDADRFGLEVLERRHDAWSRILAVFRSIYGGVEHDALRMPAMGGSLFDPDRFPFLEGRAKGTTWREGLAVPLPIDNRTVLLLLNALQVLEQRAGAQLLSYRALDVEQIGHVYEGLLEYSVAKTEHVTVGLIGSQKIRRPSITLSELEVLRTQQREKLVEKLVELTGRSAAAIDKALSRGGDEKALLLLIHACGGDESLARKLLPFADLIRTDSWGTLLVYLPGSFAVVLGSDRRQSGTHYTPRFLTESVVAKTLEPIVYIGPSDGKSRDQWQLRSSSELLDFKICDPAMGSGAFLVQVCRYLSERIVEAWACEEGSGKALSADGVVLDQLGGSEPMPKSQDERLVIARRLIAERCLYGVDINPMAVELAKLSIWLVTMAKGRPFGFLDHNFRSGDSLLGVCKLDELTNLSMSLEHSAFPQRLFGQQIGECVEEARAIRLKICALPIRDIRDVEMMSCFDKEARKRLEESELIADAMIKTIMANCKQPSSLSASLDILAAEIGEFLGNKPDLGELATRMTIATLSVNGPQVHPFHWPLVFPEVFAQGGFNAIVMNPPFMGGLKLESAFGSEWRAYLVSFIANGVRGVRGTADLCAYFLLRVVRLLKKNGYIGLLSTNTIAQGDTREVGLEQLLSKGFRIYRAIPSMKWPGTANLEIAQLWITQGNWNAKCYIGEKEVDRIDSFLRPGPIIVSKPRELVSNANLAFQGALVVGMGFILDEAEAKALIEKNPRNKEVVLPYLNGEDINASPTQSPSRWVINFFGYPLDRETAMPGYIGPVATDYPECLEIIRERVMPERLAYEPKNPWNRKIRSEWWLFGQWRWALYATIESLDRVLVRSRVANINSIAFAPINYVFSDAVVVFAFETMRRFAVLQSFAHNVWLEEYSSSLRNDVRYTPSSCFCTFPLVDEGTLDAIGEQYYQHRKQVMLSANEGLTKTYTRFHDSRDTREDIVRLRAMHEEMDTAVAAAYGWTDLDLDHGFFETKQGCRYTINPSVSRIVLDRLISLNQLRYIEEEHMGLNAKQKKNRKGRESHKVFADYNSSEELGL